MSNQRLGRNTPEETQEIEEKLKKVQKTIESFGKQAGDFSIQLLFLDFTSMLGCQPYNPC